MNRSHLATFLVLAGVVGATLVWLLVISWASISLL